MIIPGNGDLSEQFFEMQKEIKPDYCIELGAHAAEFSSSISKELNVSATAFEAGPEIYELYRDQIDNDLVDYVNYAASDVDGEIDFMIHEGALHGNNSTLKRNGYEEMQKVHKVKSYKIDTYFKDIEFKNACLWIDVEGANKNVLLGGVETLKRVSSIFIETEDIPYWGDQWLTLDVISFLNSHDFVLRNSEKVYDAQQNLIFTKIGVI
jgi:FkbM family methyltransferase